MSAVAISAVVPRRRTVIAGEVLSVVAYERPYVRTEAELTDGTGAVVLRFLGRAAVPGLVPGSHVVAEGTPGPERGALVIRNPRYWFGVGE